MSTDDNDESLQGNFPGEQETSDISVADIETSSKTETPSQPTPSHVQTNTEPNLNDDVEARPEPDQEDNITNVEEGQAKESIRNANAPRLFFKVIKHPLKTKELH